MTFQLEKTVERQRNRLIFLNIVYVVCGLVMTITGLVGLSSGGLISITLLGGISIPGISLFCLALLGIFIATFNLQCKPLVAYVLLLLVIILIQIGISSLCAWVSVDYFEELLEDAWMSSGNIYAKQRARVEFGCCELRIRPECNFEETVCLLQFGQGCLDCLAVIPLHLEKLSRLTALIGGMISVFEIVGVFLVFRLVDSVGKLRKAYNSSPLCKNNL